MAYADDFSMIMPEQRLEVTSLTSPGVVQILEFQAKDSMSIKCAALSATAESSGYLDNQKGSTLPHPQGTGHE